MHHSKIACASFYILVLSFALFTACNKGADVTAVEDEAGSINVNNANYKKTVDDALAANKVNHEAAGDYSWDSTRVVQVVLNGNSVTAGDSSVIINGSNATIKAAGNYNISGSLTNGQILVDTQEKDIVRLLLNGVNITCLSSAPIYVVNAKKVVLILVSQTKNYITDGTSYVYPSSDMDEPKAAIFSTADLSIAGSGSLIVHGNYRDGISSKDGLVIAGGSIDVNAIDDGIRGKDYVVVKDGTITITSVGNGLYADNDDDATRGYVWIKDGQLKIASSGDAISAVTDALISHGEFSLISGGGSGKKPSATVSAKGVKGLVNAIIDNGTFNINSADDAIHANANLVINDGDFAISSGDDGIHADTTLTINNGRFQLAKCYEGIESMNITINGGDIHIVAGDDGINGAGGVDGSGMGGWPGGMATGNYYLYINGGYIYVNAVGDGIDVNGTIIMTDGTVLVNGPTNNANGALDYDKAFAISGGFLAAAGSSGMAQAPGATSSQYALLINFSSVVKAGTLFHIQNISGEDILSFVPAKNYQSVAFSSPKLQKGATYEIYTGGTSTGALSDGLYQDGAYTAGTKLTSFTISSMVTRISK